MSKFRGERRLYRNRQKGIVGGVCAGVADYFEIDPIIVRILFVASLFMTLQIAFIVYWLAYFVLDNDPSALTDNSGRLCSKFDTPYERQSVLNSVHDRFKNVEKRLRNLEAYVTSNRFKLRDEIDQLRNDDARH